MKDSFLLISALMLWISCLIVGCDTNSADEAVRNVSVDYTGFYEHPNGDTISRNSGLKIQTFDLRQFGDQLEAIDNNGFIWRGEIGRLVDTTASFELRGGTSDGQSARIVGFLQGSGTSGAMTGDYIEDTLLATVYAEATIPDSTQTNQNNNGGNGGNGGGAALAVNPNGNQVISTGGTVTFNATGGTGNYRWTLSNNAIGSLSTAQGRSTTYLATSFGTQTLTLSDGSETVRLNITATN